MTAMTSVTNELLALGDERKAVADKILHYLDVLKDCGTDMEEPLVDKEGFPRADLDIPRIREARHNVICLRNDYKKIDDQLYDLLPKYFQGGAPDDRVPHDGLTPFLVVTSVAGDSPADRSGLLVGDRIFMIGSLAHHNFSGMSDVDDLFNKNCLEKSLSICLLRHSYTVLTVKLPLQDSVMCCSSYGLELEVI